MKYFKHKTTNEIFAYELDGSQDHLITSDLIPITKDELKQLQAPTPEQLKERRKSEIISRLSQIDIEAIRPLRAVANGAATEFDKQKLSKLDTEAENLRKELAGL